MHELYRLVQQVTEDTPRSTPRVSTHLAARCSGDGRAWRATMLSLSESGCLVRSSEPLNLGSLIELEFELPRSGGMRLRAEAAYQLLPDIGLIFHGLDPEHRDAISDFVTLTLRP